MRSRTSTFDSAKPVGLVGNLVSAAIGRQWRMPPRRNRVRVARAVEVPMRDGVTLLADHYIPVTAERVPTILVRCPYGRGFPYSMLTAQLYAERGYHVLLQSTRGTFGSGGTFTPAVSEPDDGQDTVAWLRAQEWFDGRLATAGGSYLGYTQWALALDPPPELTAMVVLIGVHDFSRTVYQQGPMDLYNILTWADLLSHQETVGAVSGLVRMARAERRLARPLNRLPLRGASDDLGGKGVPWYDDWVDHPDLEDPYWERFRATEGLRRTSVPTLLIGGWHDLFINQTLQQYDALRSRGVDVAMTIGPWTHLTVENGIAMPESLSWLDAHTAGRGPVRREAPVRVFVGGAGQWENLQNWPPRGGESTTLYLREGGKLADSAPAQARSVTTFRYDPHNPTPSVGGRVMALSGGAQDNRKLEARDDVLVFTTEPLTSAVEVRGAPTVELHVASDNANADLFVRICDVDPRGRSVNVTDRIIRCTERDTVPTEDRVVRITLDSTAHRFNLGHRIRLQISGGAFPRFARNLGTGENPGTSTAAKPTVHTIHHDVGRPSNVLLPGCYRG
jgi:putative CocE/NonD family hydrolase